MKPRSGEESPPLMLLQEECASDAAESRKGIAVDRQRRAGCTADLKLAQKDRSQHNDKSGSEEGKGRTCRGTNGWCGGSWSTTCDERIGSERRRGDTLDVSSSKYSLTASPARDRHHRPARCGAQNGKGELTEV